MKSNLAEMLFR